MAIRKNKEQLINKISRVKNTTITNLADFDPETTLVFYGVAEFTHYPEITDLGNLQKITGTADFRNSQVQNLGNLQTIGGWAFFGKSKIQNLGNLQTIGSVANFQNSQVRDLGNLQTIGYDAYFNYSQVQSLGKLHAIGGNAVFYDSQVQSLGNLQTIEGSAVFFNSQVRDLGNLQTIGENANFENSQVRDLGNLQTIGGKAIFGNRTDLQAEWKQKQKGNNYAEGGGVGSSTITDLADFDPETTLVFDGDAIFENYPKITDLGNLQEITGWADFRRSQVQSLGNLQTIGGSAIFIDSQVQNLGDLQTIGSDAYFNYSQVQSLGKLHAIGGNANFEISQVQSLGNLQRIGGNAFFSYSQVQSLGNLQRIGGNAFFSYSQVQDLGNLQTIGGDADFENSQVQDLGNLQTIGGETFFGNRTDLQAEWKQKQKGNNYAEGGGVGELTQVYGKYRNNNMDEPYYFSSNSKGLDFLTIHKNIEVLSIGQGKYDLFYGWDDNKQKYGTLYFGKWNNGNFEFPYYGKINYANGGEVGSSTKTDLTDFDQHQNNTLESLKDKIRAISKKMEYYGERGYGDLVVYLGGNEIQVVNYSNLSPYSAQASDREIKVSFNAPNRTMVTFSNRVDERYEDSESFEKYGGIKYIFEPLTNGIASEILDKVFPSQVEIKAGGNDYAYGGWVGSDEMPNEIIGNDNIKFIKVKTHKNPDGKIVYNYEGYWNGHRIAGFWTGGINELNQSIENRILSTNEYNRLKWLPIKELPKYAKGGGVGELKLYKWQRKEGWESLLKKGFEFDESYERYSDLIDELKDNFSDFAKVKGFFKSHFTENGVSSGMIVASDIGEAIEIQKLADKSFYGHNFIFENGKLIDEELY